MDRIVLKGTTSQLIEFEVDSTAGGVLTGLAFNTASLIAYYYREGAASTVAISLVTMTLGTWVSGGFVAVDGTHMPGVYQLGIPNAALISGANHVVIQLSGAALMLPKTILIDLTGFSTPMAFEFLMTDSSGNPKTGLTVSGHVSVDGAAFVSLTNSPTEISNGLYTVNLVAADLQGTVQTLRFSASGAQDTDLTIINLR
jgi:hypothetical protein